MQEPAPHAPLIKGPKQLIVVVALAFAIPIALGVLITQWVTGTMKGRNESDSEIIRRIQPLGQVQLATADPTKGQRSGEAVYQQVCKTCHETGLAGAHKFGDKAGWAKVIAQGPDVTFGHALSGIRAMPARGGNPDLDDVEVKRAVVYMVNKAGANWKEPAAPAAAVASTAPPAAAMAAASATTVAPAAGHDAHAMPMAMASSVPAAAPASAADGKKIYETTCVVCHGAGIAGAPKFGDKAQWAPHIAKGVDHLYANALGGINAMPPKGGNNALTDSELKAAVNYMVAAAR